MQIVRGDTCSLAVLREGNGGGFGPGMLVELAQHSSLGLLASK